MNKAELKNQALLEKISQLTTNYENQAAEYRVEVTILNQQVKELQEENNQLKAKEENVVLEEDQELDS